MSLFLPSIGSRQQGSSRKMKNRTFIPGSEWVYFKIYTGTKTADVILKNELNGYIKDVMKNDYIDKWFFIRYTDPDFHLRLRLHLKETRDFNYIFNRFFEMFFPVVDSGLVWNIQCDTYQREMERYGLETISFVEDLFFIDSVFVIKLLHKLNEKNPEQHRWKLALVLIDSFLTVFFDELQQRKDLLTTMADSFKKEFGFVNHQTNKQLNDKYRAYRKEIEYAMLWENEVTDIVDIIKDRRRSLIPVTEKIIKLRKTRGFQMSFNSLLTSIIHMTMNRWFRTKNRLHEMVIYEFLSRYYASEIAKNITNIRK